MNNFLNSEALILRVKKSSKICNSISWKWKNSTKINWSNLIWNITSRCNFLKKKIRTLKMTTFFSSKISTRLMTILNWRESWISNSRMISRLFRTSMNKFRKTTFTSLTTIKSSIKITTDKSYCSRERINSWGIWNRKFWKARRNGGAWRIPLSWIKWTNSVFLLKIIKKSSKKSREGKIIEILN